MSNTKRNTPNFKAQIILPKDDKADKQSPWPYLGNVYISAKGSMTLVLDAGVAIVLADGTVYEASELADPESDRKPRLKVHMRAPFKAAKSEAA